MFTPYDKLNNPTNMNEKKPIPLKNNYMLPQDNISKPPLNPYTRLPRNKGSLNLTQDTTRSTLFKQAGLRLFNSDVKDLNPSNQIKTESCLP